MGSRDRGDRSADRRKRSIKSHLLRTIFGPAINPNTEMPWAWTPLDVSELARVVGGGTPDTGESSYWGGPIPWCTPTDLAARTSRFIGKTERTITQKGLASSSAEVLPANIVILCSRASVGECAINTIPMATNQGFQSLVPKNKDDTHFLIYLVQSIKPRLLRISAGSTFQEFSRSELRSLTVAAPDEKRRKQIGKAFALIDGEIEYLMNSLSVYRTQKRGLMQKLLTGEWRLNGDEVQANKLARAAS